MLTGKNGQGIKILQTEQHALGKRCQVPCTYTEPKGEMAHAHDSYQHNKHLQNPKTAIFLSNTIQKLYIQSNVQ